MCTQNAEETVDKFVNRISKLASPCQFGTFTEEIISDKIMLGVSDQSTKLRPLKKEDVTLNKAVNICRSSEIANIQLKSMEVPLFLCNGGKTKLRATKDHQPAAKKPQQLETKVLPMRKATRSQAQRLLGFRPNMQFVWKGKSLRLRLFIFKGKHT